MVDISSEDIWKVVDSWKNTPGSDIQKFCMMLDVLVKLVPLQIAFNVPTRDPLHETTTNAQKERGK